MAKVALAGDLPRPVAYVLAGGASYGSVQVGQIKALAETDLEPDLVVGTSVGSLNGAVLALDPVRAAERLAKLWATVSREDVFGKSLPAARRLATGSPWLVDPASLIDLIQRNLEPAKTFEDLAVPHTAVATCFDTGDVVAIRSGELLSALQASAAIPGIFPRVEREGRRLVDGGLVSNVPMSIAAAQGAKTLVVLDCGFTLIASQRDDSLVSILMRCAAIFAAQQVRRELQDCADLTILYLPGPWPIHSRPDSFSHSEELAADAYALSSHWLAKLRVSGPGRYGEAPLDALTPGGEEIPGHENKGEPAKEAVKELVTEVVPEAVTDAVEDAVKHAGATIAEDPGTGPQ